MKSLALFSTALSSVSGLFGNDVEFGGLPLNPSLKVRLAEGVTQMVKEHVAQYARPYINTEYQFPEEGHHGINWWPLVLTLDYFHLRHHPIKMNF